MYANEEKYVKLSLFYLLFLLLFNNGCGCYNPIGLTPIIWNTDDLNTLRSDASNNRQYQSIVLLGKEFCKEEPLAVTDKMKTFAPNNHYYCSIGIYWWPDSSNPGSYINRDGIINPEIIQYDANRLSDLKTRCLNLSKAFYLTRNITFYNAFVRQLRVWFINKNTFMYPNFQYAQVIPGKNNNYGRSTGFIDAYDFNTIIESIRLVNSVKRIDKQTMDALKAWFLDFAEWADKGEFSNALRQANNNIGVAYDVTLVNMFLFAGNEERAKEIVDEFSERRIYAQILGDGSQPAELKRTKAVSYSLYNLTHIIDFCFLARCWYPNYYDDNKNRIDKAFDYLKRYIDEPQAFPYSQISSWDSCKKKYNSQIKRLNELRDTIE